MGNMKMEMEAVMVMVRKETELRGTGLLEAIRIVNTLNMEFEVWIKARQDVYTKEVSRHTYEGWRFDY